MKWVFTAGLVIVTGLFLSGYSAEPQKFTLEEMISPLDGHVRVANIMGRLKQLQSKRSTLVMNRAPVFL